MRLFSFLARRTLSSSCVVVLFSGLLVAGRSILIASSYEFTHVAGSTAGAGYADGTGSAARFSSPASVVADAEGNVFVADRSNCTIRKITPAGVVTTIAGLAGYGGTVDGVGSSARFEFLGGIALDAHGNLYVTQVYPGKLRKITPAGVVTTFAAIFQEPYGVALDGSGTVYIANNSDSTIRKMTPSGEQSIFAGNPRGSGSADGIGEAASFRNPRALAVSKSGMIYVADTYNGTIRQITPGAEVTTLAGDAKSNYIGILDGTGAAARFESCYGITVDDSENVYVTDGGRVVRKITSSGVVTTLAGDVHFYGSVDGTGAAARFNLVNGITRDAAGNLYVADSENDAVRKIAAGDIVSTLAGAAPRFGNVDGQGTSAQFVDPRAITFDRLGNAYVADAGSHTIRMISPTGYVSTFAGTAGQFGFFDGPRNSATFSGPNGIVASPLGTVYVADTANYVIRAVSADGYVSPFVGKVGVSDSVDGTGEAARFKAPQDVAVDTAGNLYVVDAGTAIRKVTPGGVVTTLAGAVGVQALKDGTGSAARFSALGRMVLDATGNIYVPDDQTIRKISPAGVVTTIKESLGFSPSAVALTSAGDFLLSSYYGIHRLTKSGSVEIVGGTGYETLGNVDGVGTSARFSFPAGMATDNAGALYIVETGNHDVRKAVLAAVALPTIVTQPANQYVAPGGPATFTISIAGNPPPSVQWQYSNGPEFGWNNVRDNLLYSGGTTMTLKLSAVTAAMDGVQFRCVATNDGGVVTSQAATLTVSTSAPMHGSRLVNLAARGLCDSGSRVMIGGFVVSGAGTKRVLVRAVGPSLTAQALPESAVLADPVIEVHQGVPVIAANDNWTDAGKGAEIAATAGQVGAAALLTSDTKSAALVLDLGPGVYTFVASGKGGSSGVVLLEVYDADIFPTSTFVNMATRAYSTSNYGVTIGGFVIAGDSPKRVLLRAVGPTLSSQQLDPAVLLTDPTIELHDASHGNGTIATSDDWRELSASAIIDTGARIGALPFLSSDTTSSAYLVTLSPGVYSFIARGKNNASGIVLVEVYDAD